MGQSYIRDSQLQTGHAEMTRKVNVTQETGRLVPCTETLDQQAKSTLQAEVLILPHLQRNTTGKGYLGVRGRGAETQGIFKRTS